MGPNPSNSDPSNPSHTTNDKPQPTKPHQLPVDDMAHLVADNQSALLSQMAKMKLQLLDDSACSPSWFSHDILSSLGSPQTPLAPICYAAHVGDGKRNRSLARIAKRPRSRRRRGSAKFSRRGRATRAFSVIQDPSTTHAEEEFPNIKPEWIVSDSESDTESEDAHAHADINLPKRTQLPSESFYIPAFAPLIIPKQTTTDRALRRGRRLVRSKAFDSRLSCIESLSVPIVS